MNTVHSYVYVLSAVFAVLMWGVPPGSPPWGDHDDDDGSAQVLERDGHTKTIVYDITPFSPYTVDDK